jgi:threonine dehydratase
MFLPDLATLDAAARTVYGAMPPTPQYSWPLINAALGTEAWIKHENHTPTGAFKVRGGLVYMAALRQRLPEVRGVVTATRGNHGTSVAFGAQRHGLQATIVVPRGNSAEKTDAMRSFGAEVIEFGADFHEAREHAQLLAAQGALHMLPSFHEDLVAGVASYWLELFRAQPGLDLVIVPIGQGSGICGAFAARHALGLKMDIVGVCSLHAPAYKRSFDAGRSIDAPVTTVVADGLACRVPDPDSLAAVRECASSVLAVTDDDVAQAMRLYYRASHNLAEGAGAAALAGAMQLAAAGQLAGRKVGLPLTGGNVDAQLFKLIL